jgi:hypothetical protein
MIAGEPLQPTNRGSFLDRISADLIRDGIFDAGTLEHHMADLGMVAVRKLIQQRSQIERHPMTPARLARVVCVVGQSQQRESTRAVDDQPSEAELKVVMPQPPA